MPPRFRIPQGLHRLPLARSFGTCAAQFALWFPGFILFADNVASIERVGGISMSPTFCPNPLIKDYILVQHWHATRDLARGQVVVYR